MSLRQFWQYISPLLAGPANSQPPARVYGRTGKKVSAIRYRPELSAEVLPSRYAASRNLKSLTSRKLERLALIRSKLLYRKDDIFHLRQYFVLELGLIGAPGILGRHTADGSVQVAKELV